MAEGQDAAAQAQQQQAGTETQTQAQPQPAQDPNAVYVDGVLQSQGTQTESQTQAGAQPPASEPLSARQERYRRMYAQFAGIELPESGTQTAGQAAGQQTPQSTGEVQNLLSQISERLARLEQPGQTQQQQQQNVQEAKDFASLVQDGRYAEAIEAKINEAVNKIQKPDNTDQIVSQVSGMIQAQQLVRTHADRLEQKHPELVEWKDAVAYKAEELLQMAKQRGEIRSLEDWVDASRQALDTASEVIRGRVTKMRASGHDDATKVREQVLSSQTLTPGESEPRGEGKGASAEPQPQTAHDVIAARRQKQDAMKGLGPLGQL